MTIPYEEFDPERLIPNDVRLEIYNLAMQNNPTLIDTAQQRLGQYIEGFRPHTVYKEVDRPTAGGIVLDAALGSWLFVTALASESIPEKAVFGFLGVASLYNATKDAAIRMRTRHAEPELSDESKRYMYLKFFERKEV